MLPPGSVAIAAAAGRKAGLTITRHAHLGAIEAADWDALLPDARPFTRHAFLAALEHHGAVGHGSGWQPRYLTAQRDGLLAGALPLYLKSHSFGEFVFDHAWAAAWQHHGLRYYPKLVVATPYTPVTGARLLAPRDASGDAVADTLIDAALDEARALGVSSLHWLFTDARDSERLRAHGFLERHGCQFHWDNPGYRDFGDFLAGLRAHDRKEIRRERRAAAAHGLDIDMVTGSEATTADLDAMHRFYVSTFERKGNVAPLSRGFFGEAASTLGDRLLLIFARDHGRAVAGALFYAGADALYGRHWGADGDYPGLHFELCYYRAIEYCIERGIVRFEAGAQGEYKVRRGFRPTLTRSMHWIAEPRFAAAIADFVERERVAVAAYLDRMQRHLPYREPA